MVRPFLCGSFLCGSFLRSGPGRRFDDRSLTPRRVNTLPGFHSRRRWGQVVSAAALLIAPPRPTDAQIAAAMEGSLRRCATHGRIRAAIHAAAASGARAIGIALPARGRRIRRWPPRR